MSKTKIHIASPASTICITSLVLTIPELLRLYTKALRALLLAPLGSITKAYPNNTRTSLGIVSTSEVIDKALQLRP
jgi:hypothetical protein